MVDGEGLIPGMYKPATDILQGISTILIEHVSGLHPR
jgi:hypothetical protein